MEKLKFKIGDNIIGIKNDPAYPKENIVGRIGTIANLSDLDIYPFFVEFKMKEYIYYSGRYLVGEWQIEKINSYKLKKLLASE